MTVGQSVADKRLNYNYHLDGWGEGGGGSWHGPMMPTPWIFYSIQLLQYFL